MDSYHSPEILLKVKPNLISSISDGQLALVLPVVFYWLFSLMFHIMDSFELAERYRIHPSKEVESRNKATRIDVLKEVIFQHLIQTITGSFLLSLDSIPMTGFESNDLWKWRQYFPSWIPSLLIKIIYLYGVSLFKIFIGFVFVDTWQYWLHRLMHQNKTLYKKFHSRHHRLYVPYAYGALYNSPVEGFILDTCGTCIAVLIIGLTHREQLILYTFATLKTVDDHCGYALPWDPFQWVFPNNAVYHDIHHQQFGIKTNFAQPFFTIWDSFCDTKYSGLEQYEKDQKRITIEKYKDFLQKRSQKNLEDNVSSKKML